MRGLTRGVFWVLWVVSSMVSWVAIAPSFYSDSSLWRFPLNAMVATLLQVLLLQRVAGVQWWWRWLIASLVPWSVLTVGYAAVPWATLSEPQWEGIFLSSLLLTSIVIGLLQWWVLRAHVRGAVVWAVVPLVSLVVALMTSLSLNATLVAMPAVTNWLGGWNGVFTVVGLVFGAAHGLVTGSVLLVLMSVRPVRRLHHMA